MTHETFELFEQKGYDTTTMLIISNPNGKNIAFKPYGAVSCGDIITK